MLIPLFTLLTALTLTAASPITVPAASTSQVQANSSDRLQATSDELQAYLSNQVQANSDELQANLSGQVQATSDELRATLSDQLQANSSDQLQSDVPVELQSGVTPMSQADIDAWREPALLASAAYCGPAVKAWNCTDCLEHGRLQILHTGGNNEDIPHYYLAKNATHLIFAIRGTNPASNVSVGFMAPCAEMPSSARFGAADTVRVHKGINVAFENVLSDVMPKIQEAIDDDDDLTDILIVGHDLGGAIGQLMHGYMALNYPTLLVVHSRLFGIPRVGNAAWAKYIDNASGNGARAKFMVHSDDNMAQRFTHNEGYRQMTGEVWINKNGQYMACNGRENPSCSNSLERDTLTAERHMGPYAGVTMGQCK